LHIPDGLLPLSQCIVYAASALPFLAYSVPSVGRSAKRIALISSLTAIVFSASAFSFPIVFGIRDHITLIPLAALIIGPTQTTLAVFVALLGQALLFQEGGITTLGANTLTMGVVAPFVTTLTYRLLAKNHSKSTKSLSIFLAGFGGVVSAALATGTIVSLAVVAPSSAVMPEVGFFPSSLVIVSVVFYFVPVAVLEGFVTLAAKRIEADKLIAYWA